MRRDMEYCRQLLSDFANGKHIMVIPRENQLVNEYTEEEQQMGELYVYHLDVLKQAGFITCNYQITSDYYLLPECPKLTWNGNEYLDSIENDTVWENTKKTAKEKGIEIAKIPFSIVKELAASEFKKFIGLE